MSRLTLAELKAQNSLQVAENLEAIKGGASSGCHRRGFFGGLWDTFMGMVENHVPLIH
jgi:hypothetical protein